MSSLQTVDQYANGLPIVHATFMGTKTVFAVPNRVALWRLETFNSKEPETVRWIDGFGEGDVFVDIGANMGLYSVFAALHRGVKVFAFEPEAENFALLNKNIRFNRLSENVIAWCCALTERTYPDRLYLSNVDPAQSGHEFGAEVDPNLQPRKAAFVQGSLGYTLDDLIASGALPVPNHVKIDVDGIEHLVVKGARETFSQSELKSVLIEISPHLQEHAKLIDDMHGFGFWFNPDQVERARRKEGPNKDYAEFIFRR